MSHYYTKQELEDLARRIKEAPPLTEEQQARLNALGEKMRSLSSKEISAIRRKVEERDGYVE